jgi:hypothetical protein
MGQKPVHFFEEKNWSKQGCFDYFKKYFLGSRVDFLD